MAKPHPRASINGFSLVELLVALVFTMVLMAGMASVFKTSLSTFYSSGELLSSARRNRMSIDLLGDDLNSAGMYLVSISTPPAGVVATNPPFYILPNMPITGAGANDPQTADELYFYMDQPLPFEGRLGAAAPQQTAAEAVMGGVASTAADRTYTIDCTKDSYANMVRTGQMFIFKDSWEYGYIATAPNPAGSAVTVVADPDPMAAVKGLGSVGVPKFKHLPGSGVVFIQPAQMVRYRIEMVQLDPQSATGVPCLVRDQGEYNGAGFIAQQPQQIITENVSGFKVYLSADSGQNWAGLGLPAAATGFVGGWDQGIRTQLDRQLSVAGRPGFKDTRGSEHWFRSIPTLVRVDITTRTATQRTEYASAPNTAAYRNLTQSLVFVPRHFGLTMD